MTFRTAKPSLIVFNAISIRTGGGLQKTKALLHVLASDPAMKASALWLVTDGSVLADACERYGLATKRVAPGRLNRLVFEIFFPFSVPRKTRCFNVGGTVMVFSVFRFINFSECAYSNIFYPDLDFWKWESPVKKVQKKLIDIYRIVAVGLSDFIFLQTDLLKVRAVDLRVVSLENTVVIRPSYSSLVTPELIDRQLFLSFEQRFADRYVFLFPCGEQKNKRLHLLPDIIESLALKVGADKFCFVITISGSSETARNINSSLLDGGLGQCLVFVGSVTGEQYNSLLMASDCVCNFAVLESFSNNLVEAWVFNKILLLTDADWARESAGQAAIYVNPEDTESVARAQASLISCRAPKDDYLMASKNNLSLYSTPEEKAQAYLDLLFGPVKKVLIRKRISRVLRWVFLYLLGKHR